jgi:hypothetical protein
VAVALGVVAGASAGRSGLNLRVVPASAGGASGEVASLVELAEFLGAGTGRPRRWYGPLPGGGAVVVEDDPGLTAFNESRASWAG